MIFVGCNCSRMARQTWKPFDFGINKSHRISSGRLCNASSSPTSPSFASRTFQSSRVKRSAMTRLLSASSSMIKTRGMRGALFAPFDLKQLTSKAPVLSSKAVPQSSSKENGNDQDRDDIDDLNHWID